MKDVAILQLESLAKELEMKRGQSVKEFIREAGDFVRWYHPLDQIG